MNYELEVLSDLCEVIAYPIPDFPLYASIGNLAIFHRYAVACHWHKDLELGLALEGGMDYFIEGEYARIEPGQAIFINSKRLHYNYSKAQENCKYLVLTIHPAIFEMQLRPVKEYAQDKFSDTAQDYLLLDGREPWHQKVLELMVQIHEALIDPKPNFFLATSYAHGVCGMIANEIDTAIPSQEHSLNWLMAWKMTGFIHQNYENKISLPEMAAAGGVCRSKCFELFEKYVGKTPNAYLTDYRIQKSCELLSSTSSTISEIALRCGFQSASYFTKVFREARGITPKEYRSHHGPSAA